MMNYMVVIPEISLREEKDLTVSLVERMMILSQVVQGLTILTVAAVLMLLNSQVHQLII